MAKSEATAEGAVPIDRKKLGQIVLVLQGGGALGAYQAGVYQALQEVGIEPDWVIGTSIGAINASLIAGNPPEMRLERLREFWDRVRHNPFAQMLAAAPFLGPWAANALTISAGVRGFFEPNPWAFCGGENSSRGGVRRLLLNASARTHAREIDRRKTSQFGPAAAHRWSSELEDGRNALL
jgi:NTE family protein